MPSPSSVHADSASAAQPSPTVTASNVHGLTQRQLEDLTASGLTEETISAAGIVGMSGSQVKAAVGIDAGSGMGFPYPGATLTSGAQLYRVKPAAPFVRDGKTVKYLSPPKSLNASGNRLYVPATMDAAFLTDPSIDLLITEGEKKTLKAIQDGFPTIGLSGVSSWKKRDDDDQSRPIDDLMLIEWTGRKVFIVFDSDAATNQQVQAAERALKGELRRRGAKAIIVRLPPPTPAEAGATSGKLGLDDFLVVRGSDALTALIEESRSKLPLGSTTASDLLAREDERPSWLVEDLWPDQACGFVAGEPKTMKSWLTLAMVIAIATGTPFLGRPVRRGPVILIDEENSRRALRQRIERLARGLGLGPEALSGIFVVEQARLRLDDVRAMEELEELVETVRPVLVVLDPLVRLHSEDENAAGPVAMILGKLRVLQVRHGAAVVIVHHMSKKTEHARRFGQRLRGSSDLHGWLDQAIYCDMVGDEMRLSFESRFGKPPEPLTLAIEEDETFFRFVDQSTSTETADDVGELGQRIIKLLEGGPLSRSDLSNALGVSGGGTNGAVERLETVGRVRTYLGKSTGGAPPRLVELVREPASANELGPGLSDATPDGKTSDGDEPPEQGGGLSDCTPFDKGASESQEVGSAAEDRPQILVEIAVASPCLSDNPDQKVAADPWPFRAAGLPDKRPTPLRKVRKSGSPSSASAVAASASHVEGLRLHGAWLGVERDDLDAWVRRRLDLDSDMFGLLALEPLQVDTLHTELFAFEAMAFQEQLLRANDGPETTRRDAVAAAGGSTGRVPGEPTYDTAQSGARVSESRRALS